MSEIKKRHFLTVFAVFFGLLLSTGGHAQSSKAKRFLIKGTKECQAAKAMRESDLPAAKAHFQKYLDLLTLASEADQTIFTSSEPAVRRTIDFCKAVKTDLERAEALPEFEKGLAACDKARIALQNGSFDEADDNYLLFQQYKSGALAISDSVLDVYENSIELRLCEQLGDSIAASRQTYRQRLLATSANQNKANEVLDLLNSALSQCMGSQKIAADKARYTQQTIPQIEKLLADTAKSKAEAANKEKSLASKKILSTTNKQRIDALAQQISDCEASMPLQIVSIKSALKRQAANAAKPGGKKSNKSTLPDSDAKQIVGVAADYPRSAINRGVEGYVQVKYTVTKQGDVANIEIIDAKPKGMFDRAVRKAVERYKYQPKILNGVPVDQAGIIKKITFKLQ